MTGRSRTSPSVSPAGKPAKGEARGVASARRSVAKAPTGRRSTPTQRLRAGGQVPGDGVGRRTVSMPQDVLAEVDSRVGARGFSPYVAEAVRRQLRHDKLSEFLEQAQQAVGPLTDEDRKAARRAVAAALSRASAAAG